MTFSNLHTRCMHTQNMWLSFNPPETIEKDGSPPALMQLLHPTIVMKKTDLNDRDPNLPVDTFQP